MNHIQTKLNLDTTICVDYYSDSLLTNETIAEMKRISEYIQENLARHLRDNPFSMTRCVHCGHLILTNRDYLDTIKCQNCNHEFPMLPIHGNAIDGFINKLHAHFDYEIRGCEHMLAYMLCVLPNNQEADLLFKILEAYGFRPSEKNNLYARLLHVAKIQNWVTENSVFVYAVTELTSQDCIFKGHIPRVEACSRMIRHVFKSASTVSADVSADSTPTQSYTIREQIEQLIAENRLEEATKLLEQL